MCTVHVRDRVWHHYMVLLKCKYGALLAAPGILSMTQTFSFAAAIVDDGITLLNGSIDIIGVT